MICMVKGHLAGYGLQGYSLVSFLFLNINPIYIYFVLELIGLEFVVCKRLLVMNLLAALG